MGQDPTAPFRHAARWVGRAIDPFVRLQDAFHVGGVYDWMEAETDEGREVPLPNDDVIMSMYVSRFRYRIHVTYCLTTAGRTEKDRLLHRKVYQRTKSLVSSFSETLDAFADTPHTSMKLFSMVGLLSCE